MGMDDAYKMINQTLVSLINEIWELEEKAIITDEFKPRLIAPETILVLPLLLLTTKEHVIVTLPRFPQN